MQPSGTLAGLEVVDFIAGESLKSSVVEPRKERRIELDSNLITNDLGSDGLRSHIGRQAKRGSQPVRALPTSKSTRRNDRDGQRRPTASVRSATARAR